MPATLGTESKPLLSINHYHIHCGVCAPSLSYAAVMGRIVRHYLNSWSQCPVEVRSSVKGVVGVLVTAHHLLSTYPVSRGAGTDSGPVFQLSLPADRTDHRHHKQVNSLLRGGGQCVFMCILTTGRLWSSTLEESWKIIFSILSFQGRVLSITGTDSITKDPPSRTSTIQICAQVPSELVSEAGSRLERRGSSLRTASPIGLLTGHSHPLRQWTAGGAAHSSWSGCGRGWSQASECGMEQGGFQYTY